MTLSPSYPTHMLEVVHPTHPFGTVPMERSKRALVAFPGGQMRSPTYLGCNPPLTYPASLSLGKTCQETTPWDNYICCPELAILRSWNPGRGPYCMPMVGSTKHLRLGGPVADPHTALQYPSPFSGHRWELPVLHYHEIMVIYHYPFWF